MLLVSIVSECSMSVAFSYGTIYGNFGTENMKTRHSTTHQSCTLLLWCDLSWNWVLVWQTDSYGSDSLH